MEAGELREALRDLAEFARRYQRLFGRPELGGHAQSYLRGLLSRAKKNVPPMRLRQIM